MLQTRADEQTISATRRPRLGFLGVGWIGRDRMRAILETGLADAVGICEPVPELAAEARKLAPGAEIAEDLGQLLAMDLDGLVIATPSALHAEQSIAALERGVAVFCQKPLGRNAAEVRRVTDAARASGALLGVDMSYRFAFGMQRVREVVQAGELGRVFAAELAFHNAYGPDKPWFYDRQLSGGGCVIDLGVHLVDLALWTLDFPAVTHLDASLYAGGERLGSRAGTVEDYAAAKLDLACGASAQISCSWRLHAGVDAIISASFYGTDGGITFRNVNGSFYDFMVERFRGTSRETVVVSPEARGGRAAADWAERLALGGGNGADLVQLEQVAEVLDGIYRCR
jgi:predicted dehydrogenase